MHRRIPCEATPPTFGQRHNGSAVAIAGADASKQERLNATVVRPYSRAGLRPYGRMAVRPLSRSCLSFFDMTLAPALLATSCTRPRTSSQSLSIPSRSSRPSESDLEGSSLGSPRGLPAPGAGPGEMILRRHFAMSPSGQSPCTEESATIWNHHK